jgi:hypothetical protein
VALIGAIATALLGLLAKDPGSDAGTGSSGTSTTKLSALMMITVLLMGSMASVSTTGCTQAQKISVAQEIVNWTPAFISTADTVNAAIMALDPVTITILGPITVGINAFGPEFQKAAQAYLNNPSQTTLQVLQALIVQIQQDTNSALLAAAKIVDPTSQATATRNINLIATIVNTLLALIQGISSKTQIAAMAQQVHIPLRQVRPYMDEAGLQSAGVRVSHDLQLASVVTPRMFFDREAAMGF